MECMMSPETLLSSALKACESIKDPETRKNIQRILSSVNQQLLPSHYKEDKNNFHASSIQQRFAQLLEKSLAISCSTGKEKPKILSASPQWLETFAYEESDVINSSIFKYLSDECRGTFYELILAPCLKNGSIQDTPVCFLKSDQTPVEVLVSGRTEKDEKGKVTDVFLIMNDITPLKQAQDAIEEQEIKTRSILNAIQDPLKNTLSQLTEIKGKVPQELRGDIDKILEQLSGDRLLEPYFSSVDIDMEVNRWLIKEYSTSSYSYFPENQAAPVKAGKDLGILNSLSFNAFNYEDKQEELVDLTVQMFEYFDLLNKFGLDSKKLAYFLNRLKDEYRHVPYHNFLHAFDVTQVIFYFLTKGGLSGLLTDLDVLALLMSAISHDVCHPGLNNNFQQQTRSPLALTYNDQSVLENHHVSSMFQILHHSGCNLLDHLEKPICDEIRKVIISNILATDMNHHFDILNSFSERAKSQRPFESSNRDDRLLIMKLSLKCGDVCNPARPYRVAKKWAKAVMEEFFHQGDLEKAANIPVSSFMDRTSTSIAKCQSAFIEFIAKPLFGSYANALPNLQECLHNLEDNSQRWHEELEREKKDS